MTPEEEKGEGKKGKKSTVQRIENQQQ